MHDNPKSFCLSVAPLGFRIQLHHVRNAKRQERFPPLRRRLPAPIDARRHKRQIGDGLTASRCAAAKPHRDPCQKRNCQTVGTGFHGTLENRAKATLPTKRFKSTVEAQSVIVAADTTPVASQSSIRIGCIWFDVLLSGQLD